MRAAVVGIRTHSRLNCLLPLRSIRRSVSQPVLLSLVTSLITTRLNEERRVDAYKYGRATLSGFSRRWPPAGPAPVRRSQWRGAPWPKYDCFKSASCFPLVEFEFRLRDTLVFRCRRNMAPLAHHSSPVTCAGSTKQRRCGSDPRVRLPWARLSTVHLWWPIHYVHDGGTGMERIQSSCRCHSSIFSDRVQKTIENVNLTFQVD